MNRGHFCASGLPAQIPHCVKYAVLRSVFISLTSRGLGPVFRNKSKLSRFLFRRSFRSSASPPQTSTEAPTRGSLHSQSALHWLHREVSVTGCRSVSLSVYHLWQVCSVWECRQRRGCMSEWLCQEITYEWAAQLSLVWRPLAEGLWVKNKFKKLLSWNRLGLVEYLLSDWTNSLWA